MTAVATMTAVASAVLMADVPAVTHVSTVVAVLGPRVVGHGVTVGDLSGVLGAAAVQRRRRHVTHGGIAAQPAPVIRLRVLVARSIGAIPVAVRAVCTIHRGLPPLYPHGV
jgi:hypothetical protein